MDTKRILITCLIKNAHTHVTLYNSLVVFHGTRYHMSILFFYFGVPHSHLWGFLKLCTINFQKSVYILSNFLSCSVFHNIKKQALNDLLKRACWFAALSSAKVALPLSFTQIIFNLFGQSLSMLKINYVGFYDKIDAKWW